MSNKQTNQSFKSEEHRIVLFLKLCRLKNWDLDDDDIYHVLDLDFDYIKDQHILTKPMSAEEAIESVTNSLNEELVK